MKKQKGPACRQAGQAVLALILIMAVALAIGVSVIQKSLVDVSTSTKVEQSQQAFSAAEAGIEKALRSGDTSGVNFPETGAKTTLVQDTNWLPYTPVCIAAPCPSQQALEYPPLSKEDIAHVWLADPDSSTNPPAEFYDPPSSFRALDIYWGDPTKTDDKAAIQIKIVYYDSTAIPPSYCVQAHYLDPDSQRASQTEGFTDVSDTQFCSSHNANTILGDNRPFFCKYTISSSAVLTGCSTSVVLPQNLMILRARLLYNSDPQQFAVQVKSDCTDTGSSACYLPPQARLLVSTGESGPTQRTVQVFQEKNVVPFYFDYAIFSAGEISK